MMKGRNNGKKLLAVRIVAHAFEIIHLLTDQNPIQVRSFALRLHLHIPVHFVLWMNSANSITQSPFTD